MGAGMRLALFGSSVLGLLYVGFMFSNNMTLMLRPEGWQPYFDGYGKASSTGAIRPSIPASCT